MNPLLIVVLIYLVGGLVAVAVVSRGEPAHLGEYGCIVMLGWPFFLVLFLFERGFAPSPMAARPHRQRLAVYPAVGRVGVAVGDLRPAGKVAVGDQTYDARADRFVASGGRVVVTGTNGFGLLVRPLPNTDPGAAPVG